MNILITGGTGLVGKRLIEQLLINGYKNIRVLSRNKEAAKKKLDMPVNIYEWNPYLGTIEENALKNLDIVIHLAGENVADGRWSNTKKDAILESRRKVTEFLNTELAKEDSPPSKFISASAIGYYGDAPYKVLTEESHLGDGYLPDVCKVWESTVLNHNIPQMKTAIVRVGIVLSPDGGALKKMLPPFKMGVGGILGDGNQIMSWIHIQDLVNLFIHLMEKEDLVGIYNGTAPFSVSNKVFTKTLGHVLNRPTIFPVPKFALNILFGEMAVILLSDQNVKPVRTSDSGFNFKFADLKAALDDLLDLAKKGEHELKKYQWVSKRPDEIFTFFSDEMNLEKITPPFLKFKVLGKNTEAIREGSLINYKLRLRGFPIRWRTRINKLIPNVMFIDEQIKGPYTKWVHQHDFIPNGEGTLICDRVVYKIPFGPFGSIAKWPVQNDLNRIFEYRQERIHEEFTR